MVAQCGTSALLFGSGDLIAQQGIEKKGFKNHDVRSSLSMHTTFSNTVPVGTYRPHNILRRFPLWTRHHKVVPVLISSPVLQPNEEGHL